MIARLLLLTTVMCLAVFAETKRDWQSGKLVKIDAVDIVPNTHAQRFFYTIDTGTCQLVVTEKVVLRWSQPLQASQGETVKWAIDKKNVYVLGPGDKERMLSLRRRDCK